MAKALDFHYVWHLFVLFYLRSSEIWTWEFDKNFSIPKSNIYVCAISFCQCLPLCCSSLSYKRSLIAIERALCIHSTMKPYTRAADGLGRFCVRAFCFVLLFFFLPKRKVKKTEGKNNKSILVLLAWIARFFVIFELYFFNSAAFPMRLLLYRFQICFSVAFVLPLLLHAYRKQSSLCCL